MKFILLAILLAFITGCSTIEGVTKRARWVTDAVCIMTPEEQALLAQQVDEITYPNKVRVQCID